jgi:hypothetical protein
MRQAYWKKLNIRRNNETNDYEYEYPNIFSVNLLVHSSYQLKRRRTQVHVIRTFLLLSDA